MSQVISVTLAKQICKAAQEKQIELPESEYGYNPNNPPRTNRTYRTSIWSGLIVAYQTDELLNALPGFCTINKNCENLYYVKFEIPGVMEIDHVSKTLCESLGNLYLKFLQNQETTW